jgi:hypothetical protein
VRPERTARVPPRPRLVTPNRAEVLLRAPRPRPRLRPPRVALTTVDSVALSGVVESSASSVICREPSSALEFAALLVANDVSSSLCSIPFWSAGSDARSSATSSSLGFLLGELAVDMIASRSSVSRDLRFRDKSGLDLVDVGFGSVSTSGIVYSSFLSEDTVPFGDSSPIELGSVTWENSISPDLGASMDSGVPSSGGGDLTTGADVRLSLATASTACRLRFLVLVFEAIFRGLASSLAAIGVSVTPFSGSESPWPLSLADCLVVRGVSSATEPRLTRLARGVSGTPEMEGVPSK